MAEINKDTLKIGVTFTPCDRCERVEVVHGRWVGHYDGSWIHKRKWLTGYDCSVCGNFINTMTPYCPYCGAKMDEERKDNGK